MFPESPNLQRGTVKFGTTLSFGFESRLSLILWLVHGSRCYANFLMTIFAQLIGFGSIPTARYGMTMGLA